MRKFIASMCLILPMACAPELRGKGERCDELTACDEGFECYRGYCVAEEGGSDPTSVVEERDPVVEERGAADAGMAQYGGSSTPDNGGSAMDGAGASGSESSNESGDAGGPRPGEPQASKPSSPAVTASPATADAGSPNARPTAPVPDTGPGSGANPPAASSPPPASPPTSAPPASPPPASSPPASPPASPPPALDAGARADAGPAISDAGGSFIPDAGLVLPTLPRNCTLEECCAEAFRAQGRDDDRRDDDDEGNRGRGGKQCGCSDPALLPALLGGLTCTLGGVVGGLL